MKKKEKKQLQVASIEELKKQILEVEKSIEEKLRDRLTKATKNVREVKMLRHRLAQIKTFLRMKEEATK